MSSPELLYRISKQNVKGECDSDSSDSDDCRVENETVRKVMISGRSKKNPEPLPADPKLKDSEKQTL